MLTLTLKHEGNKPSRMSTVLATCANALMAEGYTIYYSPDGQSLLIREREILSPPRKDLQIQPTVPVYAAIKVLHDFEEDRRAQLLEDQGPEHGK